MDDFDRLEQEFMKNPEYVAEVERRRPAFELASSMIGIRAAAGLTQQELAARTGMSQPVIARLESGAHMPSWATLAAILKAIDGQVEVSFKAANGEKVRIPLPVHLATQSARSPKPIQEDFKGAPRNGVLRSPMKQRRGPTATSAVSSQRRTAGGTR